jgi:hypothetical protein
MQPKDTEESVSLLGLALENDEIFSHFSTVLTDFRLLLNVR